MQVEVQARSTTVTFASEVNIVNVTAVTASIATAFDVDVSAITVDVEPVESGSSRLPPPSPPPPPPPPPCELELTAAQMAAGIIIAIEPIAIVLAVGNCHCAKLLDLRGSLLWVEALELGYLRFVAVHTLELILVVHIIVEAVGTVRHRVLLLVFVHDLQVNVVVHLESAHFDLVLPDHIVQLHVVQDRVN